MPSDGYRLAPLARIRVADERASRHGVATAIRDATELAARATAADERVAAARAELARARAARTATMTAVELMWCERYAARCRRVLAAAVGEAARAHSAAGDGASVVESARATLTQARAQKVAVEQHFARWRDAQQKAKERAE
jgi:hypothetical protein